MGSTRQKLAVGLVCGLITVSVVFSLQWCVGLTGLPAKAAPDAGGGSLATVQVVSPIAKLHKDTDIVILGAGFEPGQEVRLIVITVDGIRSDIGTRLEPAPVANERGAWITVWDCNRFVRKKLLAEGVFPVIVTDDQYNTLAYAAVAFYDVGKPEEEWPSWARTAVGN